MVSTRALLSSVSMVVPAADPLSPEPPLPGPWLERTFAPGAALLAQGDVPTAVYEIRSGWVLLSSFLPDGRRQVVDFCLPGSIIGLQHPPRGTSEQSAQTLTRVAAAALPVSILGSALLTNPLLAIGLAQRVAAGQERARALLVSLGRRTARERVAHLLLDLFVRVRLRVPACAGEEIPLPLTQEHLADAVGLSPKHVNRMLRLLREHGVVALHGRTLRVLDHDRLLDEAGVAEYPVRLARAG